MSVARCDRRGREDLSCEQAASEQANERLGSTASRTANARAARKKNSSAVLPLLLCSHIARTIAFTLSAIRHLSAHAVLACAPCSGRVSPTLSTLIQPLTHFLSQPRLLAMAAVAAAASSPSMLLISESTVESCLPPSVALHLSAQAFLATHAELATVPPYSSIVAPCPSQPGSSDATLFKAAQLGEALGVKVVVVRPANESRGLPSVPACILLSDASTGLPSALVQATHLTALRTAAGSAAATDALVRKDASVLACFGAGMQASEHIKAVCAVRPIRTVRLTRFCASGSGRQHAIIRMT